jgi:hypothetical protein
MAGSACRRTCPSTLHTGQAPAVRDLQQLARTWAAATFGGALVYAGVLLALAFAINALLTSVQQRAAAWAQS